MSGYSVHWGGFSSARNVADLLDEQDGVASRAQLHALGVDRHAIHRQVRARRWRLLSGLVVVTHRGPVTRRQRCWVAVLAAGSRAAVCGLTAAELDGLAGFNHEAVHVVVPRGVRVPRLPGVRVHESRRFAPADVHPGRRPPRTTTARSVVDAAVWSRRPGTACGIVAAAVQQGLVTASQLREVVVAAGAVRYRRLLLAVLGDIEGGSHSLAELDMARLCRRSGLPAPVRQAVRHDEHGRRRYLDLLWPDHGVCVEVDGGFHREAGSWLRDQDRQNEIVLAGLTVLRFPSVTVRLYPEAVIGQLARALGRPAPPGPPGTSPRVSVSGRDSGR